MVDAARCRGFDGRLESGEVLRCLCTVRSATASGHLGEAKLLAMTHGKAWVVFSCADEPLVNMLSCDPLIEEAMASLGPSMSPIDWQLTICRGGLKCVAHPVAL